uniref:Cleavage and polyadenylation specificity factor subunit 2 n=1 Tax=Macrostomum lignano TaxID=282301 RepID=A0A1I8HSY1_9PLAT
MATCIVKLRAFSGAQSETPPCFLLQIDEFKLLLDCGWDSSFKADYVEQLKPVTKEIDAVLLSHSDPFYIGALPYLVGRCGLTCPIYSTVPVRRMGQMMLYDLHASHATVEEFNLFSLDDIDAAFDRVHQLKYQQTVTFEGKGHGIAITPLPAGHSLGATLWKIVDGEEEIVYALGYNHKKERHLNGASFDLTFRPSLLITDCANMLYNQRRRRARDEQLMTSILGTLRDGGNVLIATDTAGRCLELTHLLEQLWQNQQSGLMAYSLALLNCVAHNVVEHAKSQVEWMSDRVTKQFELSRDNPFNFRYLHVCHSLQDLARVREPRVVLASQADLDWGFTRQLFQQCASRAPSWRPCSEPSALMPPPPPPQQHLAPPATPPTTLTTNPATTKTPTFDDYGEPVDPNVFNALFAPSAVADLPDGGRGRNTAALAAAAAAAAAAKAAAEKRAARDAEPPSKCLVEQVDVDIRCTVAFIDFEGRSDGDAVKKIVSTLKPRETVLVLGSRDATDHLAEFCRTNMGLAPERIHTPANGETVDVTKEAHIYQARVKDSLISSLTFFPLGEYELAWVDASIHLEGPTEQPTLVPWKSGRPPDHKTVFIGEPKLHGVKQRLQEIGMTAEFQGGVLVVNGRVAVKRTEAGRLLIEGACSEDYFRVRELVYSQYAIL